MRVLVTGAAGFIGSHLADRLLAGGHELLGIDTLVTGRAENVPAGMEFYERCVTDFRPEACDFRPDVIVHAAASYRDPRAWRDDAKTNVLGAVEVAEAALACGVARVVYFQTSLCYGLRPPPYPMTEQQPLDPQGSYAVSKTAGEAYLLQSGLDVVSFRLANVYGPRNVSGPVPTFWKRLVAGEPCTVVDSRRDFVYVSDAVDVFEQAVLGHGARGVYHVATGGDYPIGDLYNAVFHSYVSQCRGIATRPASRQPRGPDDVETILLDPSKTETAFDWRATTALTVGVRQACAWYSEYGVGETYTHLRLKDAA